MDSTFRGKWMVVVVAGLLIGGAGCQRSETSQVKRARLIAAQHMEQENALADLDAKLEKLKSRYEQQIKEKEEQLAVYRKKIEDLQNDVQKAVAERTNQVTATVLDENARFKDVAILIMVGKKDGFIGSVQRLDERMKSLNIPHEYMEVPGKDHGGIIMGGMTNVFRFFGQHTKPSTRQNIRRLR